jgi:hypothetical protein
MTEAGRTRQLSIRDETSNISARSPLEEIQAAALRAVSAVPARPKVLIRHRYPSLPIKRSTPIILCDRPDHIGLKRDMGAKFEIYIGLRA